jgi:hypothetical protein
MDLRQAWAARRVLAEDVLKMLLSPGVRKDSSTDFVIADGLARALTRKSATPTKLVDGLSLDEVVSAIRGCTDEHHSAWARHVALLLDSMRDAPLARLLFSPGGGQTYGAAHDSPGLLVFTMQGLELPAIGSDPHMWTMGERLAIPLLHLAAHLTSARAYTADREAPKLTAYDEAHFLARFPSGRNLLARDTRDSRKNRHRVLVASQLPQDILGHNVGGLTNEVFIGRIEDPDAQAAALQMLRVPQGAGYEAILGGLSQPDPAGRRRGTRDWLIRDAAGRVERFIVDLSYDADLALALNPAEKLPVEWLGREAA